MDPNLYFRFAMPGWTAFFAASVMLLATGNLGSFISIFEEMPSFATLAAGILAFLGAPAFGFLANTVVVAFCDLQRIGPVYSKVFRVLLDRAKKVCHQQPALRQCLDKLDKDDEATAAALMALF